MVLDGKMGQVTEGLTGTLQVTRATKGFGLGVQEVTGQ